MGVIWLFPALSWGTDFERGVVRLSEIGVERKQRDTSRFPRDHGDVASKPP
jgi:hypothetical protein